MRYSRQVLSNMAGEPRREASVDSLYSHHYWRSGDAVLHLFDLYSVRLFLHPGGASRPGGPDTRPDTAPQGDAYVDYGVGGRLHVFVRLSHLFSSFAAPSIPPQFASIVALLHYGNFGVLDASSGDRRDNRAPIKTELHPSETADCRGGIGCGDETGGCSQCRMRGHDHLGP